tara:strand:- start:70 stop:1722 length:1653 start_codon:yes stop_codon:yes gene_type:complete
MRFRRIEKDVLGTNTEHIQGTEDDINTGKVVTSESKTYIGSKSNKKVDMNKIKNTKIGDDIHYYVNGIEGRGIVVKMGNEYLEVFKEDGKFSEIHINDTFFVKDILINKQWDDMDDEERYTALIKIHAPSPRFIRKSWADLPPEIKVLLRKEGHTFEEGKTKDAETTDHTRTGAAQNSQFDPNIKEKTSVEQAGADTAGHKEIDIKTGNVAGGTTQKLRRRLGVPSGQPSGIKKSAPTGTTPKADSKTTPKKDLKREGYEDHPQHFKKDPKGSTVLIYDRKLDPKGQYERTEHLGRLGQNFQAEASGEKGDKGDTFGFKTVPKVPNEIDRDEKGNIKHKERREAIEDASKRKAFYQEWLEKINAEKSEQFKKIYGGKGKRNITKPIPDSKGGRGDFKSCEEKNQDKNDPGAFCGAIQQNVHGKSKSDVEHGRYSNPGGTPEVGVSTDTKVDVTEGTGYEERPHISLEEAGNLPRSKEVPQGGNELHVSGDKKNTEPKFTQPHNQDTVRKVGLPQQHPNSYGVRYGMKGGVKKVWCPEHQVWEETTKDWHE